MFLNKNRVFISYSTVDRESAEVICSIFAQYGYHVWIDYQNLNFRHCVKKQISDAIEICDFFALILSCSSKASSWVRFEWHQAQKLRKPAFVFEGEMITMLQPILVQNLTKAYSFQDLFNTNHFGLTNEYYSITQVDY